MKVVINRCWGGFGLSAEARQMIGLADKALDEEVRRDDPRLITTVESLGEKASGSLAKLVVIEIPDGIKWTIEDYDGMESVHEAHRSW